MADENENGRDDDGAKAEVDDETRKKLREAFLNLIGHGDTPYRQPPDNLARIFHNDIKHNDIFHMDAGHGDIYHADLGHNDILHVDAGHNDIFHVDAGHNDILSVGFTAYMEAVSRLGTLLSRKKS